MGPASPWFLWAARSCFVALQDRSLLPGLHSQLLGARGRWHRFVYPWMLLWEERASVLQHFPLDRDLGGGRRVRLCHFTVFILLALWEDLLLPSKLKTWKKKRGFSTLLLIVISRHKCVIKKTQDIYLFIFGWKDNSRNVIWLHVYFFFSYLVDSVSRGGSMRIRKKSLDTYGLLHWDSPATYTHTLILHFWSMTIQGCPCQMKTEHQ